MQLNNIFPLDSLDVAKLFHFLINHLCLSFPHAPRLEGNYFCLFQFEQTKLVVEDVICTRKSYWDGARNDIFSALRLLRVQHVSTVLTSNLNETDFKQMSNTKLSFLIQHRKNLYESLSAYISVRLWE